MSAAELALKLLAWAVASAFMAALTYLLHRLFRTREPALDAISFLFLAVFNITAFLLLAGLSGLLTGPILALISAGGLILIVVIPGTRRRLAAAPGEVKDVWDALKLFWSDLPAWLRWLTGALGAVSLLRFAFLIWALPPFVWDSMTYHLTNVAYWTQTGRIALFDTSVVRIYTPANYEVLAAWFTVFLHHDAVVEAAGLPAYAIALLAVYAASRALGCSRSASWIGAMGYASTPALLLATTGTKNDPHMAAYYLAAVSLLLSVFTRRSGDRQAKPLARLGLLALLLATAFGTKAYLLHLLPGMLLLGLIGGRPWERNSPLKEQVRSAIAAWTGFGLARKLTLLLMLLVALFLAGYWNVRNWTLTGNPFYPYGVSIEGAQVFASGERTARLTTERLAANLASLGTRFGDRVGPIQPDLPEVTGWGWVFYGLGLPLMIWALARRRGFRPVAGAFLLSFLALMLSVRPSPWNMRYAAWLPALAGYAYALFADALPKRPQVLRIGFGCIFAASVALNLAMTLNYNRISVEKFKLMLERPLWRREASVLKLNMPAEYEHALLQVPDDQVLGYQVHSDGFIYPLFQADFAQRLVYVAFSGDETCEAVALRTAEGGAHYLFVATGHTDRDAIALVEQCARESSLIRAIGKGVYEVQAPD